MFKIVTVGNGGARHFTGLSANRCPVMKRTDAVRLITRTEVPGTIRDLWAAQRMTGVEHCTHCVRAAQSEMSAFVEIITGATGVAFKVMNWAYNLGTGSGTHFISTTDRTEQYQCRWMRGESCFTVDRLTSYGSNEWETVATVPFVSLADKVANAFMVDRLMREYVQNHC